MNNEFKQITRQTTAIYRSLRNCKSWITVSDIQKDTGAVPRTIRGTLKGFVDETLVEVCKAHGGFRYRLNPVQTESAKALAQRIHAAEKTFGMTEAA